VLKNNESIKKFDFSSFTQIKNIEFNYFSDFPNGVPCDILLIDSTHLLINSLNQNNSYFLYLVNKEGSIEKNLIKKGKGPQEAISFSSVELQNGKVVGYDMSKNSLFFCEKGKIIDSSNTIFSTIDLGSLHFYDLSWLNDSLIVGTGESSSQKKILLYNVLSKKIEDEFGIYSNISSNSLASFKDAATSYIAVRPNRKNILLVYRYTDVIEIYDNKGLLIKSLQGPKGIELSINRKMDTQNLQRKQGKHLSIHM